MNSHSCLRNDCFSVHLSMSTEFTPAQTDSTVGVNTPGFESEGLYANICENSFQHAYVMNALYL